MLATPGHCVVSGKAVMCLFRPCPHLPPFSLQSPHSLLSPLRSHFNTVETLLVCVQYNNIYSDASDVTASIIPRTSLMPVRALVCTGKHVYSRRQQTALLLATSMHIQGALVPCGKSIKSMAFWDSGGEHLELCLGQALVPPLSFCHSPSAKTTLENTRFLPRGLY